jgi:hypothetical protein
MVAIKVVANYHPDDSHQPSKQPDNRDLGDYLYHGCVSFHHSIGHGSALSSKPHVLHVEVRMFRWNNSRDMVSMSWRSASISPPCRDSSIPFKAPDDQRQINFV